MADEIFLACDLGNSGAKFGIAANGCLAGVFRLPLGHSSQTADSLGLQLRQMLAFKKIFAPVEICVAVSVAPAFEWLLKTACLDYLDCDVVFAGRDFPVPLEVNYKNPQELGADRLAAAFAARLRYPEQDSLIVADYGTAITFDCIDGMFFEGGLIFPGLEMSARALASGTAKLPYVSLAAGLDPDTEEFGFWNQDKWEMPAKSTRAGIRYGLLAGYAAISRGICENLAASMQGDPLLLATGGHAHVIAPLAGIFNETVPDLILEGLIYLYKNYYRKRTPAADQYSLDCLPDRAPPWCRRP